jgi:hypothetical protein
VVLNLSILCYLQQITESYKSWLDSGTHQNVMLRIYTCPHLLAVILNMSKLYTITQCSSKLPNVIDKSGSEAFTVDWYFNKAWNKYCIIKVHFHKHCWRWVVCEWVCACVCVNEWEQYLPIRLPQEKMFPKITYTCYALNIKCCFEEVHLKRMKFVNISITKL